MALFAWVGVAAEEPAATTADEAADKREKIDAVARETLDRLFEGSPAARKLHDQAYGWAVFSNLKVALGVSGAGGSGVAVNRKSDERTYMKMGSAGVGLGLGGRKYQVVFLFEDQATFDRFVNSGWQAETSANATAGTAGADVASTFQDGLAIYQLSDKGLMAQAEIAGTKYWKADKLN
jgi:lipid-binding SYLF domain-containing protein